MQNEQDESILQPFFISTYHDTHAEPSVANYVAFVEGFAFEWAGEFLHPFGDNLFRAHALDGSAFYCFLVAQTNILLWLETSLLCGSYELVMRELRTILEGMFPAYYLDFQHPRMSVESKLTSLRKLEESHVTHGKKAFAMSGVPEWKRYYRLYKQLCSYTHISMAVTGKAMRTIATEGYAESTDFHFDRELFVRCTRMWREVTALALTLAERLMKHLNVEHTDLMMLPTIKSGE